MAVLDPFAYIVAARYGEHYIGWPRPDGNPFPYERAADARRYANKLNNDKRKWQPLNVTINRDGEPFLIKVDRPEALRFGVYDWITHKEII